MKSSLLTTPIAVLLCGVGLFLLSLHNYLLFHSLAELFSIVIAAGVFMVSWNARHLVEKPMLVHLGIAYLCISFLDLFHTISYQGMGVFTDYDYYANQVWIAARYVEAGALLAFALFGERQLRHFYLSFLGHAILSSLLLISIFVIPLFPVCFIPGEGQTSFKIISEYVIILTLLAALLFFRRRTNLKTHFQRLILWSILATIGSELAFTLYVDNYGLSNLIGHYLKIISFTLLYFSLVREAIRNPIQIFYNRLERMTRELQTANDAKNQLFSIIGHDLKNSLNSAMNISDLLLKYPDQIDIAGEEGRSMLAMINNSNKNTNEILDNLLAWGRNETGMLEPCRKAFDVERLLGLVVDHQRDSAKTKKIELLLESEESLYVKGDKDMIQTCLRNLTANAIKFTPSGGRVILRARRNATDVIFEVQDTGIGIPREDISRLLHPSGIPRRRGTANETGVGLGLRVSIGFLEKHSSELHIESEENRGSRFYFGLPASQERPEPEPLFQEQTPLSN